MNILVINGPNLNLLGKREPDIYGSETLDDIQLWLREQPEIAAMELQFFQSNHEGALIDALHENMNWADGILINPGAFTHYSYAIRDAIAAVNIPTVEVHLSDIYNREDFRKISVIKPVCIKQICGLGKTGFLEGLKVLLNYFDTYPI
ncbi:MAG: type II 3-dehydroquinate dehydratase [Candidatus Heimdallarchaeota archaeon]|nr:type II 3-dehydroquinate dehydratase [Candidatus Heimdallarchaeota archaeon]